MIYFTISRFLIIITIATPLLSIAEQLGFLFLFESSASGGVVITTQTQEETKHN